MCVGVQASHEELEGKLKESESCTTSLRTEYTQLAMSYEEVSPDTAALDTSANST